MYGIGDVCLVKIYYKGTSGPYKKRPVLIFNTIGSYYTITEITSVPPKVPPGFYDQFKEPIHNWQACGLDESSYAKCANTHNVEKVRFVRKLGTMDADDFMCIVERIADVPTIIHNR